MADAVVEEHEEVYFSIACQTGNMAPPLVYDYLKMGERSGLGACCVQQKRLVLLETLHRLHRRRPSQHRYHYYRRQPLFMWLDLWQSFVQSQRMKTMRICLPAANLWGSSKKNKALISWKRGVMERADESEDEERGT